LRDDVCILQAECARTPVLDRPVSGRILLEEVLRENLDLGRPSQVQLICGRRVPQQTRSRYRFRSRVITPGVGPSLYVDDKHARIKQDHTEGRALRTATSSNDTRACASGQRRHHRPALRAAGCAANRRLRAVPQLSHDGLSGAQACAQVPRPPVVNGHRVSALPLAAPRVQALCSVVLLSCLRPNGCTNKDLRAPCAALLGRAPSHLSPGQRTDDRRRLRRHGRVPRLAHTQRDRLTPEGRRTALFFTRV
jgi:hypothetical protein